MRKYVEAQIAPIFDEIAAANTALEGAEANVARKVDECNIVEAELARANDEYLQAQDARSAASGNVARLKISARGDAYTMAADADGQVSGEGFAAFAEVVFRLNGKTSEVAEREASVLERLAGEPVPAIIDGTLTVFGGDPVDPSDRKVNKLVACLGDFRFLGMAIRGDGDKFFQDGSTLTRPWHWSRSTAGPARYLSAKDLVVTDDEFVACIAAKRHHSAIVVGHEAVEAVLDMYKESKPDHRDAVKYLLAAAAGDKMLGSPEARKTLAYDYGDVLYESIVSNHLDLNRSSIPAALHPDLYAREAGTPVRGDTLARALQDSRPDYSNRTILERLEWKGSQEDALTPLSELIERYEKELDRYSGEQVDFRMSPEAFGELAKTFAQARYAELAKHTSLLRLSPRKEVRQLRRIAKHPKPYRAVRRLPSTARMIMPEEE